MANNVRNSLIRAAVAAALCAAPAAQAFDTITVDRDGAGGTTSIFIDSATWGANTVLLQGAFSSASDGFGGFTQTQNNFDLFTHGAAINWVGSTLTALSGLNCGVGQCGPAPGSEFTFQVGVSMLAGTVAAGAPGTTQFVSDSTSGGGINAAGTYNFFKVFYDTTAANFAKTLEGTGFGSDLTAAGSCAPGAQPAGAGLLVLCGKMLDAGITAVLANDTGLPARVPLDAFGTDNYDGAADGGGLPADPTPIGTLKSPGAGGGSLNLDVEVTYQDFAFFVSNISTAQVGIDLNQNGGLKLNYVTVNPSKSILGNTWDVGGGGSDSATVTVIPASLTLREMNNFACSDAAAQTCDFVSQSNPTTSFNGTIVPEPGSLALLGLGLGAGAFFLRRRRVGK